VKARHHVGQGRHACGIDACTFAASRKDNLQQHRSKQHGLNVRSERQKQRVNPFQIDTSGGGHITGVTLVRSSSVSSGIDEQSWTGATFLQAATMGNLFTLKASLNAGMNIDFIGDDGSSALHCAARVGKSSALRYLLEHGAHKETENAKQRSPLHEAILSRDLETVECLLHNGAKLSDSGITRTCLGQCGCMKILQLCLTHLGMGITGRLLYDTLKSASRAGHIPIVTGLLSLSNLETNHPDANIDDICQKTIPETSLSLPHVEFSLASEMHRNSFTPLHMAAAEGHLDVVQTLVYHRFDINETVNGQTPLHLAARGGRLDVAGFLLSQKTIDIDYKSRYGLTPLHLAAKKGKTDVVKLLLKQPNLVVGNSNLRNETPLHLAARNGYSEVIQLLLQHSHHDDTCCLNREKRTPLQLTAFHGHWNVAGLLLRHEMQKFQGATITSDEKSHTRAEIMRMLLEHPDFRNINSPEWRCGGLLHSAIRTEAYECIQMLLCHEHIDVNVRVLWSASPPLHFAARLGRTEAVVLLLQHKNIDVSLKLYGNCGDTAIQIAREKGHGEIVDLLIRHGAKDIEDIALSSGSTPAVTDNTTGIHTQLEAPIVEDLEEHSYSDKDENMDGACDDEEEMK
jgi:ankyrin repeat protein